jgi:cryptochrome
MAAIHWFRKGLRLHDNPALAHACANSAAVFPVFVLDPAFADEARVGVNR